jgi:cold shock CspA family protein
VADYSYGTARKVAPRGPRIPARPPDRRGTVTAGRIAKLCVGQGHGFIRLTNDREVYFHRSDVCEGSSINDLVIGETVMFELLEDTVSGARALKVKRRSRRR